MFKSTREKFRQHKARLDATLEQSEQVIVDAEQPHDYWKWSEEAIQGEVLPTLETWQTQLNQQPLKPDWSRHDELEDKIVMLQKSAEIGRARNVNLLLQRDLLSLQSRRFFRRAFTWMRRSVMKLFRR